MKGEFGGEFLAFLRNCGETISSAIVKFISVIIIGPFRPSEYRNRFWARPAAIKIFIFENSNRISNKKSP